MIRGLYLITDENRDGLLLQRSEAALRGGARILQMRSKLMPAGERTAAARALKALCGRFDALFLINDDPHLALESGADGVHLGQKDMPLPEARVLLGDRIIGVSTRTVEQAILAEAQGADYVAVGSIFPTSTKGDAEHVGVQRLKEIRRAVRLPIVAIGGIDCRGAGHVVDAGADALAVISSVMGDPYPSMAAREIALAFNRRAPFPRGRILTIAGSDSGGGAGIQADLKTFALLGAYGASAITALTAQNTLGVRGIHPAPAGFVAEQIEAVLCDIGADIVKTGMLFNAEIVSAVAAAVEEHALLAVIDPVMIAKGGASLLKEEATERLRRDLLPRTWLLTPNIPEAEALTGLAVQNEGDMERAARLLQEMGARNVLLKGGHLTGEAVDLLLTGETLHRFATPRIETRNTHGTGCTYSAAIAAFVAQGEPLPRAVSRAKDFISEAIRTALPLGEGHGPVNHWKAARKAVTGE
jgi:hydroxymethylpyrimidine kinase / phosphomethylpyrimidine kinase / thiamine-phosphate diphosphorylase